MSLGWVFAWDSTRLQSGRHQSLHCHLRLDWATIYFQAPSGCCQDSSCNIESLRFLLALICPQHLVSTCHPLPHGIPYMARNSLKTNVGKRPRNNGCYQPRVIVYNTSNLRHAVSFTIFCWLEKQVTGPAQTQRAHAVWAPRDEDNEGYPSRLSTTLCDIKMMLSKTWVWRWEIAPSMTLGWKTK